MDKFEKLIKDSVEGFEAPYSADAWQSLNKAMGPSKATILKWVTGSAAVILFAFVGYNYFGAETEVIDDNYVVDVIEDNNSRDFISKVENSININGSEKEIETENLIAKNDTEQVSELVNELNSNVDEIKNISIGQISPINGPLPGFIDTDVDDYVNDLEITQFDNIETVENSQNDINTNNLIAVVNVEDIKQCLNSEFTFTPSIPKQKAIYEWHLGDGTVETGGFITHTYSTAGHYDVVLVLKDLKSKKIIKTSETFEVTVIDVPKVKLGFEHLDGIIPNTYFDNRSEDAGKVSWDIEGLYKSNQESFNYSFKKKGIHKVNLTITNINGCSTTEQIEINVENDFNLLAPNAFTPDGDNLNDDFIPKALLLLDLPFVLNIYDRQGNMVYQTNDSSRPWDGLYKKDGIPAPNGIYVWVCQLTREDGEKEIYQSQVLITK